MPVGLLPEKLKSFKEPVTALYWHFPFCQRRCAYCHFYRLEFSKQISSEYLQLFKKELLLYKDYLPSIRTVYFGGGSPSLLEKDQLREIGNFFEYLGLLNSLAEWTIECNPQDLDQEKLNMYRKVGINRISLGVQSFFEKDLKILNRPYDSQRIFEIVEQIRTVGFTNLNFDLMIGFPGQSQQSIETNLQVLIDLLPEHVSIYIFSLKNESHPKMMAEFIEKNYHLMAKVLKSYGYDHYEVSNFARPNLQCQHNLVYWRNQSYIGCGVSASGFLHGIDYRNFKSLPMYRKFLEKGKKPQARKKILVDWQRELICRLRLQEGVEEFILQPLWPAVDELIQAKFLKRQGSRISVNFEQILLLNSILAHLLKD